MAKKRVLLIEAIWAAALCAQPCLVRNNPGQLLRVETFAGQIEPKLTPIQPASRVTVALVPQSIPEDLWRRASDELAALHRAVGARGALTLAVFDGQSFVSTDSLQRPAAWRKAVDQALATGQGQPLPEPAAFYAAFLQAAANFGGDWLRPADRRSSRTAGGTAGLRGRLVFFANLRATPECEHLGP